ncbi:hypothetical protein A2U01_0058698, partial [Trifolium medium]|nr:hypothetical protein [Trifolium medium]
CLDEHRVLLGGYVLHDEADHWRRNANQRLGANGAFISWARFKREFLTKYFPADERNRKVIEFMELKHGECLSPIMLQSLGSCAVLPLITTPWKLRKINV